MKRVHAREKTNTAGYGRKTFWEKKQKSAPVRERMNNVKNIFSNFPPEEKRVEK